MKKSSETKVDGLANSKPAARKKDAAEATENLLDGVIKDIRLGFLMHDVSRLRRTVFDEFMKPLGVTRSQWWVLAYLSRQDGMIQSDLADTLELGKAALGGLLDRLEHTGLLERRPDALDRRVKRVYLTSEGIQTIKKMRVKSQEMSERILAGLNLEDRHALEDMLGLVKSNLVGISKNSEDA